MGLPCLKVTIRVPRSDCTQRSLNMRLSLYPYFIKMDYSICVNRSFSQEEGNTKKMWCEE